MSSPAPPQPITVDELLARHHVLLLDAYGVLVHSKGPLPGAAGFIARLNRERRPYSYLSTTRPGCLKTPRGAIRDSASGFRQRMITSGLLLESYFAEHGSKGRCTAVLGTSDSERYVERAGGVVVQADRHCAGGGGRSGLSLP